MKFEQELQSGELNRRYKRFLADISVETEGREGAELTIHCPNTGAMTGCNIPGSKVWFSQSDNPKRKYPHTWEMLQTIQGDWACINTGLANRLVEEAIVNGVVRELSGYKELQREVRYGEERSRIDMLLQNNPDDERLCYIEVKSVTLLAESADDGRNGVGMFPDAVSTRGQKHLRELMVMADAGHRAVLFFCVNHTGIDRVRPADHIDTEYGRLLRKAAENGVEVLAYKAKMNESEIVLTHSIPVDLS